MTWVTDRLRPGGGPLQPLSGGASDELDLASIEAENENLPLVANTEQRAEKKTWHRFHMMKLDELKWSHPGLLEDQESLMVYVKNQAWVPLHLGRQSVYRKGTEMLKWEYYCAARKCSNCPYRVKVEVGDGEFGIWGYDQCNDHAVVRSQRGLPLVARQRILNQMVNTMPMRAWKELRLLPGLGELEMNTVQAFYNNHRQLMRKKLHDDTLDGWSRYCKTLPDDINAADLGPDTPILGYFQWEPTLRVVLTPSQGISAKIVPSQRQFHRSLQNRFTVVLIIFHRLCPGQQEPVVERNRGDVKKEGSNQNRSTSKTWPIVPDLPRREV